MVFDEGNFPHFTINLDSLIDLDLLSQCFQLTSRSECLAEGVAVITLQIFRAKESYLPITYFCNQNNMSEQRTNKCIYGWIFLRGERIKSLFSYL